MLLLVLPLTNGPAGGYGGAGTGPSARADLGTGEGGTRRRSWRKLQGAPAGLREEAALETAPGGTLQRGVPGTLVQGQGSLLGARIR